MHACGYDVHLIIPVFHYSGRQCGIAHIIHSQRTRSLHMPCDLVLYGWCQSLHHWLHCDSWGQWSSLGVYSTSSPSSHSGDSHCRFFPNATYIHSHGSSVFIAVIFCFLRPTIPTMIGQCKLSWREQGLQDPSVSLLKLRPLLTTHWCSDQALKGKFWWVCEVGPTLWLPCKVCGVCFSTGRAEVDQHSWWSCSLIPFGCEGRETTSSGANHHWLSCQTDVSR